MSVYDLKYPGRRECEEHWAKVRAGLVSPSPEPPAPSLAEQVDAQIRRLQREIAEWQTIKNGALS